jgi:hypothetical protein
MERATRRELHYGSAFLGLVVLVVGACLAIFTPAINLPRAVDLLVVLQLAAVLLLVSVLGYLDAGRRPCRHPGCDTGE